MDRLRRGHQAGFVAVVGACAALALAGCAGTGEPSGGMGGTAATPPGTSSPPPVGGPGDVAEWKLVDPGQVAAQTTTLHVSVSRASCADGMTGEVLAPTLTFEAERIIIQANVAPLPESAYSCQSNDWVPLTVELAEPVGERELFDALCLDSVRMTHSYCIDGGVRWRP